jgi:diguanylate cyclase (GGDEF)-like protein
VVANRFEDTFVMLGEALALLDEPDELDSDEGVYSLAAYVYSRVGEFNRARQYAQQAILIAEREKNRRDLCIAHQRLGYVDKMAGQLQDAALNYQRSIEVCHEIGDDLVAGVNQAGYADLLRMQGDYVAAVEFFESAIERLTRAEFEGGLAEARLYWARLERERDRPERVRELLSASLEYFETESNWEYLAETHQMLAEVERQRGNLDNSIHHYDRFMQARERHLNLERGRQLAYLEVEFDTTHKEQLLELATERARISELEAYSQRQQLQLTLVSLGVVIMLVVALVLLLVHTTRERRRYQNLSRHDALTGLSNHTRFFELATVALARSREQGGAFTLIMADIDHFKQINDQLGHSIGDRILQRVASRIKECFGGNAIVGRLGGEEFGIALPGTRWSEAEFTLRRVRATIRETRAEDLDVPVTLSFGVAEPVNSTETLAEIRERADQALYLAKGTGRDRVQYAQA